MAGACADLEKAATQLRGVSAEAGLLLIGIPVLLWTMIPIYHMFLFAISPKDAAFSGQLWPAHPTLRNFEIVFGQQHHFLYNFWRQMWNSLAISCATALLTLVIASAAAFAISRLRMKGGRLVMNLALFTYFIPAAFLAVPMYKTMGMYGLLNNDWALILAMVTVASPYAIWILRQASDKLPVELDEAALIDGASPWQLFRMVYIPLMVPSLIAVGTYALLLAWNEYLYAFLLLSNEKTLTLPVALGNVNGVSLGYAPGTPEPNFTAAFDSWPINPAASVDRYVLGSGTLTPETQPAPAEGDDQFVADPTKLPATFYSGDGNGKIYKFDLEGKLVGWAQSSENHGQNGCLVHELHCESENVLYKGDCGTWTVEKITFKPAAGRASSK